MTCAGTSRSRAWSRARRTAAGRRLATGTRPIDDQGYHLGVVHLGVRRGGHRYAVRWYTPYTGPARPHRFVVLGTASAAFA